MTSASKVEQMIHNSEPDDWIRHSTELSMYDGAPDETASSQFVATYENNVDLRIEQGRVAVEDFSQEWSDRYPDADNNVSYSYWIVYGRSPIDHVVIVTVDGGRARIPIPLQPDPDEDDESWTITEYQDSIGAAVNGDYQAYRKWLKKGGVEVE